MTCSNSRTCSHNAASRCLVQGNRASPPPANSSMAVRSEPEPIIGFIFRTSLTYSGTSGRKPTDLCVSVAEVRRFGVASSSGSLVPSRLPLCSGALVRVCHVFSAAVVVVVVKQNVSTVAPSALYIAELTSSQRWLDRGVLSGKARPYVEKHAPGIRDVSHAEFTRNAWKPRPYQHTHTLSIFDPSQTKPKKEMTSFQTVTLVIRKTSGSDQLDSRTP